MSKFLRPNKGLAWLALITTISIECKTVNQSRVSEADFGQPVDADTVYKLALQHACEIMAEDAKRVPDCKVAIIEGICSLNLNSLQESVHFLSDEPNIKKVFKTPKDRSDFEKIKQDEFTTAAMRCRLAETYRIREQAAKFANQIKNNPDAQKQRLERRRAYAHDFVLGTASAAVWMQAFRDVNAKVVATGAVDKAGKAVQVARAPYAFVRLLASGICSLAVHSLINFSASSEVNWDKDQCSLLDAELNSWHTPACQKTFASVCNSLSGMADINSLVQNIPGIDGGNEYLHFVSGIGDALLYAAGNRLGDIGSVTVGVINQSANQIAKALTTSNNDWGECLLGQRMRCIGQRWGEGGWSNQNAVAAPRREIDRFGQPWWVKSCCLCTIQDLDRWGHVNNASRRWEMSVIQQGDFASGSCGQRQGLVVPDSTTAHQHSGYNRNIQYDSCRRVDIIGSSCSLQEARGSNTRFVKRLEWDQSRRQRSGKVISVEDGLQ